MCQITPFMFLTPVRCEIPNLHFLSLVRRMTPLLSRSRSAHPLSERLHLRPQRLAELRDTGPALPEITFSAPSGAAVGPPIAGCTLMPVGSFAPVAKKIP